MRKGQQKDNTSTVAVDSDLYAEFLRERIYGSITLFAVVIGLIPGSENLTIGHIYAVVGFTTIGLWAASLFAFFTARRVTHGVSLSRKQIARTIVAHRGILLSAVQPLIVFTIAAFGFIELRTALVTASVLIAISLFFTIRQSTKSDDSKHIGSRIVSFIAQLAVVAAIVLAKLAAH